MHKTKKPSLCVQGEIRLTNVFDSSTYGLLRAIEDSGSINQAAKQLGLSYKSAWTIIERANNKSPKTLITTETGGAKGGGTCLTSSGRLLLSLFAKLEEKHQQFLLQLNQAVEADPEALMLLRPLTIKTSVANQLFGVVTEIKTGPVATEVVVKLKGEGMVCSSLSHAEAKLMALSRGSEVLVLINSNEISLVSGPERFHFSARNQLPGIIRRINFADIEAEVVIYLQGGDSISAVITQQSAENMGLKTGMRCKAIFKSNSILLAPL